MKKWILSAAIILACSGFAAAQSTTSEKQPVKATTTKAPKKITPDKKGTPDKTTVKAPANENVKLLLPVFTVDSASSVPPKGKND